jgi:hypothetical protein
MSRRIEIELTSDRGDGTWTWRAAGARAPKGVLNGTVLPDGLKVGDIVRAEADFNIEGIDVLSVMAPKGGRKEDERLELVGSGQPFEAVTQTLAERSRNNDRDRSERNDRPRGPRPDGARGPRPDGARPGGPRPDGARGPRPDGARGPRPDGARPGGDRPGGDRPGVRGPRPESAPRRDRPFVAELPQKPKAKRLRAGRTHRNAMLETLPEEHRPIAEQVIRGGIPAVRQALAEQNEGLKAAGQAEITTGGVLALAEALLPKVRVAEWLDRAEGAQSDLAELDLRDLRSVVVAAEDPTVSRDESTRALAAELKAALAQRQDSEHAEWLTDITQALDIGRSVRALRLSSRPPKAGVRFPAELAVRLAQATTETVNAEASSDRWVAVLEALAFSPIRNQVVPPSVPAAPTAELMSSVKRFARQLPAIAAMFGLEAPAAAGKKPGVAPRPPRPPKVAPPVKAASVSDAVATVSDASPVVSDASPVVEIAAPVAEPSTPVVETAAVVETAVVAAAPAAAVEAPAPAAASTQSADMAETVVYRINETVVDPATGESKEVSRVLTDAEAKAYGLA